MRLLKLLTGRYAGDVREVSPMAADALLADGRAALPSADDLAAFTGEDAEPDVSDVSDAATAPVARPTGRRR